jgi:hypothetical protein
MTERTTVRLAEDLLSRAKRKAAAEGRTLTSLIEEGLRGVVADKRGGANVKRVMPRTSVARGGLAAHVDLNDLTTLQEVDDLDYVRRMRRFE